MYTLQKISYKITNHKFNLNTYNQERTLRNHTKEKENYI